MKVEAITPEFVREAVEAYGVTLVHDATVYCVHGHCGCVVGPAVLASHAGDRESARGSWRDFDSRCASTGLSLSYLAGASDGFEAADATLTDRSKVDMYSPEYMKGFADGRAVRDAHPDAPDFAEYVETSPGSDRPWRHAPAWS